MNRREFLRATSAGMATITGCTGARSLADDGTGYPAVTVRADDAPGSQVSMAVSVRQGFTETGPARIRVVLRNESSSERRFAFGPSPPFSEYLSDGDLPRLVAVPENDNSHLAVDRGAGSGTTESTGNGSPDGPLPSGPVDGCWSLPGSLGVYGVQEKRTVPAGGTVSGEYVLLNHPDNPGCLPNGEYRFVSERYFGADAPWGFTVTLQERP